MPDAVATRCRAAIAAGVAAAVPDFADKVFVQGKPESIEVDYPCVICTPGKLAEQEGDATSARNQVGYRTLVLICDRATDHRGHEYVAVIEAWREAITAKFRRKPLAGVSESVHCLIEPLSVFEAEKMGFESVVSSFIVRAVCYVAQG
jgi:hypothetical protein